jgi:hypothetical protein
MIVTIFKGCERKVAWQKNIYFECAYGQKALKGGTKKKRVIVKVLVIMWRSDCVLNPQAYLHK